MLNHTFTWNGHSSDEFGIKIERFRNLNRPARKYDYAAVPGRNGNVYSVQKAWDENVQSYQIWAKEEQKGVSSLVVSINPIQSGSGDPSPTNIRDISGRTAVNVYRTGKNLLPYPYLETTRTVNGLTFTDNGDGTITVNGTATAATVFQIKGRSSGNTLGLKDGTRYTISGCPSGGSGSTYKVDILKYSSAAYATDYGDGASFTYSEATANDVVGQIRIVFYSGVTVSNLVFKPMIRIASDSDETTTISLGRTVYGGTLNVTTGELVVDKAYVEYDGSSDENWTIISASEFRRFHIALSGTFTDTLRRKVMCNKGVYHESGHADGTVYSFGGNLNYYINSITTLEDFKTWLASNPLQVVYELATPLTYQLTATEVETLSGGNSIWADSGDVLDLQISEESLGDIYTSIMEWLNSADGYARLEDTYDLKHYREAVFLDATDITTEWGEIGRAVVSFRCRPERFVVDSNYTYAAGEHELYNPTNHIAKPLIKLALSSGSAQLIVNDVKMQLTDISNPIIDCETENVTNDAGVPMNQRVTITDIDGNMTSKFISLKKGMNIIQYSGSMDIDARFWEL